MPQKETEPAAAAARAGAAAGAEGAAGVKGAAAEGQSAAGDAPTEPEVVRFHMPSPIGELAFELTDRQVTGVHIAPRKKELARYAAFLDLMDDETQDAEFLEELFGRISEYFSGARRRLDVDYSLAGAGVSGFARRVLRETAKIPFGRTRTYGEIAEAAGRPDAYRLVLAALVDNPLPIVVPCHRVTTNKSGIGSYVAGKKAKRWLLEMEKRAAKELAAAASATA